MLELYADECVDVRITEGIRRRGVDIVTARERGLLGAPDPEQAEQAILLKRVFVTADRGFLAESRRPSTGLIFIKPTTKNVGDAVRLIAELATFLKPSDMLGQIEWV